MATQPIPHIETSRQKKPLVRRAAHDRSQAIRHGVQLAFLLLNGWLGAQFILWTLYFERGGSSFYVPRPAGIEGWLPIAGLMNTKYFVSTGHIPLIHPAAMFLFLAFVAMSLLLKKAFCSWLCPVGTLSERLWQLGQRIFGGNLNVPRWIDIPLRGLKYLLLSFFLFVIGAMSAAALDDFMQTPYGIVADVKMLNFFRHVGPVGAVVLFLLVAGSVAIRNFWCRYLCPYGALLGLVSLFSPAKIRRDREACIDCAKCAHACPSGLAVDKLVQIRSAECTACMACVAACPAENALQFALPSRKTALPMQRWQRRTLRPAMVAAVLVYLLLASVLVARATNHWNSPIPRSTYLQLVPRVNELSHPGM